MYIGQSEDVQRRLDHHQAELERGTHSNKAMQADYNKYSAAFEYILLEECYVNQLNMKESYYIKKYNATNPRYGYNGTKGGARKKRVNKRGRPSDLMEEVINSKK